MRNGERRTPEITEWRELVPSSQVLSEGDREFWPDPNLPGPQVEEPVFFSSRA